MFFLKKIKNSSYSWLSIQEAYTFLVNYGLLIFLAKVLEPDFFGVVALLNLYTTFFSVVAGFGIEKLIVKEKITNMIKLNALFLGNFLISILLFLTGVLFLFIFIYLYFNGDYLKYYPLGILSLFSIFTSGVYKFSISLYVRDKKFVKMAKLVIASYTISFVLVVLLSFYIKSEVTLLLKQIIVALIPIIILIFFSDFKFRIIFSKAIIVHFYSFSKYITLNNLFNFFVRNIDYMIIGKFFDKAVVGQYSIAYRILVTPVKMLVKQVDSISFPSLVEKSKNLKLFKSYYLSNIKLITETLFPIIIAIIMFSNLIVEVFFDTRYTELAGIISILSISSIFQSVTSLVGNLYIISNKTKLMFKTSIFIFILLAFILYVGATKENIYYFAASYVFAYVFTNFPIANYLALNPFKISIVNVLSLMIKPIIVSVFFLGALYFIYHYFVLNIILKIGFIVIDLLFIYLIINEKIQKILGIKNVWNSRGL